MNLMPQTKNLAARLRLPLIRLFFLGLLVSTSGCSSSLFGGLLSSPGPSGAQGQQGDNGAAGTQGASGPSGPSGPAGSSGPSGPSGQAGPSGPSGSPGQDGSNGAAGPSGQGGLPGLPGLPGNTGQTGSPGQQGQQGTQGSQGQQGAQGPQGAQGNPGLPGSPGTGCPMTVTPEGPDFSIATTDDCKLFLVSVLNPATPTAVQLPTAAKAGASFTVGISKAMDNDPVNAPHSYVVINVGSATDKIGNANAGASYYVYLGGSSVTLTSDGGSNWTISASTGETGPTLPQPCDPSPAGGTINLATATDCYQGSGAPFLAAGGMAITGTAKILQAQQVSSGQFIWVQLGGSHVLSLNINDSWQPKLNADGNGVLVPALATSDNFFDQPNVIAGWSCMPSIYKGDTPITNLPMIEPGCVFYDSGLSTYSLDFFNGNVGNTIGKPWGNSATAGLWYAGNHQICALAGMRLPTIFETQAQFGLTGLPSQPGVAFPTFAAAKGVPSFGASWTATSFFDPVLLLPTDFSNYFLWTENQASFATFQDTFVVRCVLE